MFIIIIIIIYLHLQIEIKLVDSPNFKKMRNEISFDEFKF